VEHIREHKKALLIILLVLLVGAYYTWTALQKRQYQEEMNTPAMQALSPKDESVPYTDLSGNQLAFDDYLGDILVVNSWASWSPDSKTELTMLGLLADEYKDRGVRVIAINRAEQQMTAERFLNTIGVSDKVQLVLDLNDQYYKSIAGYAMPETVIYGRSGEILSHYHGLTSETKMRSEIEITLEN
jgi:thiol-disulfide isomerase/thioredoxin